MYWSKKGIIPEVMTTIGIVLPVAGIALTPFFGLTAPSKAAHSSRNIFQFFSKFFGYQKKLFEFVIGLWRVIVEIISTFRGIFRL